jgi:DNA-binding MarR family transcriptional regulator
MGILEVEAFEQEGFSELSWKQLLYLETITRMERPTYSDLAKKLAVTRPSVSAQISKLIEMGYVDRVQSEQDRRVFHIVFTPKGKQFTAMHDNLHRMVAERLTEKLNTSEQEQLIHLLQKMVD